MNTKKISARTIAGMAMLTAIVIVLQLLGAFIKFGPFSVSLVLIPIVLGASLYGWLAGGWLGLVFGAAVLLSGDAAWFLGFSVPGTIVTVLLKGILAGITAGITFKLISKFNLYAAVIVSAIVCPVVNTGIFLLGCQIFFMKDLVENGFPTMGAIIIGMVGLNFIFELIFNVVLSPVVIRVLDALKLVNKHNK